MSTRIEVAVIGGGLWGRALAAAAARAGSPVTLISRRAPEPIAGVTHSPELRDAARARLLVLAAPSAHVVDVARELGPHLDGGHYLVHGVRGLIGPELRTISEVVRAETPIRRLGAIGGPVLAPELALGEPSVMVIGSRFREVIDAFREGLGSPSLRLYPTRDLVGLEWASALTGCLAIASGFAVGTGLGPGVVAAFTTRAVHEAARVAVEAGGEPATLLGLAGLGDLLAAVAQKDRPEVVFGRAIAGGMTREQASEQAGERIEALALLPALRAWTEQRKVRAPILATMVDGIFGGHSRAEMIKSLMSQPLVEELS